jgi:hypothetical protein
MNSLLQNRDHDTQQLPVTVVTGVTDFVPEPRKCPVAVMRGARHELIISAWFPGGGPLPGLAGQC